MNNAIEGKAQYSESELIPSVSWDLSRFISSDRKRQIERDFRKEQKADIVFELISVIDENDIIKFSKFVEYISKHLPQFKAVCLEKHGFFRDYINDRCDYMRHFKEIEHKYNERVKAIELDYQVRFEDFQREMQDKIAFRESQIADLEYLISKITKGTAEIKEYEEIKAEWERDAKLISIFDAVGVDDSQVY